jgi:FkbM family methyltransferase
MPSVIPSFTPLQDILLRGSVRAAKERGDAVTPSEAFDFLTFALRNCHRNYAQLAQDLWVLHELRELRGGYFVEFGASNGILLSNTYLLEKDYGWGGVLAEPNPIFHRELMQNRKCHVSRKCISGKGGEAVVFNATSNPHLSTIDVFTERDLHAGARRDGIRIQVQSQTLGELLHEAAAPRHIDYMSIDVEGGELDVLQNFDFAAYSVTLLTVEHNNTPDEGKIDALLAEQGYVRRFAELSLFDGWYRRAA